MTKVLITTPWIQVDGDVDTVLAEAGFEVVRRPLDAPDRLVGVDAVIAGTEAISRAELEAADRLRVLIRTGVGYDSVDVTAATRLGIAVGTTPGSNRNSVAELVLALMLSCARHVPQSVAEVRSGSWVQRSGVELAGSQLGIVGLGSIGKAVATIALALGMTVCAYDEYLDRAFLAASGVRAVDLPELLSTSDFVTLHTVLDDSTRHLIDAAALESMRPSAYLINTARGGIVDEAALAAALRAGTIGGAALDVLEKEPLAGDSPLHDAPNLIITPHVAGATTGARGRSGAAAAEYVIDFLAGRPIPGIVNPEYATASDGARS